MKADERPLPVVEPLVPAPDPASACEALEGLPYRLFLDSAARTSRLGRYSFLTADPIAVVCRDGAEARFIDRITGDSRDVSRDPLDALRTAVAPFAVPPCRDVPPFQCGVAGYLAYEWGQAIERVPAHRYDDLSIPNMVLGVYDWVIAWDHAKGRAWLLSTGAPESSPKRRECRAVARADAVIERLRWPGAAGPVPARDACTRAHRGGPAPSYRLEPDGRWDARLALRSSFTRLGYLEAVARARDYILSGDVFQVNIAQRIEVPLAESPWATYKRLRLRNPAPFAAFLDFPDGEVLSASPERYLRVDLDGRVETRPIKGTRPRGLGPEHDAALGEALLRSEKDRAENLMIVDLMRNDLSRICRPGSVCVPELFTLEHHATVHHLVSAVVGQLERGRDALDLIQASFPGGSITGAPKIRAMEIIAELEPTARGVYCGTIAYWGFDGSFDSSIAIRTALVRDGRMYFGVGGAVVADSDPKSEYCETLDKACGLIAALDVPA